MKKIIVINHPKKWKIDIPGVEVISPKTYLTDSSYAHMKGLRIFNLCYDYAYQKRGYYVSLLAEARGQKVIPSVKNIMDLRAQTIIKSISEQQEALIQKSLKRLKSKEFILSVYFGRNVSQQYDKLAKELHKLFQAPFLRARFNFNGKKWEIHSVRTISFKEIPEHHLPYVESYALSYFSQKRYNQIKVEKYRYDLAILINPEEISPPSNKKAISLFSEAAAKLGCYVELITKDDYHRLGEFDALFIRETTAVNHHTYRMARRAQNEGLAVIDSPDSILKCCNKVYLAELLQYSHIPTPKTIIIHSERQKKINEQIGFPCVLKLPDSSFSQGVIKVESIEEMKIKVHEMMKTSDLLIAQEYLPTNFDWRVGVLDQEILFVCKYYMAKNHWQIYNWQNSRKNEISGGFEIIKTNEVPKVIIKTALKATHLLGKGLYGVDLKCINKKAYVIEINDNPNIDAGVEDELLKEDLYRIIIENLLNMVNS